MRMLYILLFLLCNPSVLLAEGSYCFDKHIPITRISMDSKNHIGIFYKVPASYKVNATSLACVLGTEFIHMASALPDKASIGIVSDDYRNLSVIQWNISEDYLLLLETVIPNQQLSWTGRYTKYPQALARIKEIIINKPFPRSDELSLSVRKQIRVNFIKTSVKSNQEILNESK